MITMETVEKENDASKNNSEVEKKLGVRHLVVLMISLAVTASFSLRASMSVAIVAMRNKSSANPDFPDYNWDSQTSGMILSSFYFGYMLIQLPSGIIVNYLSPSKVLTCSIFFCSLFNLLIPFVADYGYVPVMFCRAIVGLCQGCLLPCNLALMSRWIPAQERGRLLALIANGSNFAIVLTMPISGWLSASRFGWPSIFYLFSALGIIWSISFYFLGADFPTDHSRISQEEANFINSSLGNSHNIGNDDNVKKKKIPWKGMLTSAPVWVIILSHCGQDFFDVTLLSEIPTYLNGIFNFDASKSGTISTFPYLGAMILSIPISYLADFFVRKGALPLTVYKVCNTIGVWIPAVAFTTMCLVDTSNESFVLAFFIISVSLSSSNNCGFFATLMHLAPNFTGTLIAVTNFISTVCSTFTPLVVSAIVTNEKDVTQWYTVFYISSAASFTVGLIFLLFGKAEVQPWNVVGTMKKREAVLSDELDNMSKV